ncbi:trypsin-like cysteine/serine peptidase domain-containing protein [Obelidium mucronatum]|nr:trypsin-like cysteine/serine peptidase domain-containing protein [Obelidium mucronatum]
MYRSFKTRNILQIFGFGVVVTTSLNLENTRFRGSFNWFGPKRLHCESILWPTWSQPKRHTCVCKSRNFVADAAEKVLESVVNIMLETVVCSRGSGFIVDADGLVLTNAHVVQDCTEKSKIIVTLADGREYPAVIHAVDFLSDLAVLKITPRSTDVAPNLTPVTLGSKNEMRAGDWVVSIGNPFGLQNTITAGVVSSQRRKSSDIGALDSRVEYLQTDCIIHSGSSGGPLVNLDGEVIGINTIRADSEGISFAIKIDHSLDMIKQLMEFGKITRPYFGFGMVSLTPYVWQQLRVQTPQHLLPRTESGILITSVEVDSPAFRAGCLEGDVIVEVNGQTIQSASKLLKVIGLQVRDPVQMRVNASGL